MARKEGVKVREFTLREKIILFIVTLWIIVLGFVALSYYVLR